jgi:DnaJ-class molecular chaperone
VKVQYKKMALQYHPDKNKSASAEERFKEIGNAYNFLLDNAALWKKADGGRKTRKQL